MRRRLSRTRQLAGPAGAVAGAAIAVALAWPAPAHAADLFPVDDWLGDGLKHAGDVVLGPLKLSAKAIAQLLATIVGALADLLVPKSFVRAGIHGISWLVQPAPVGIDPTPTLGAREVSMPHLKQLRDTLTWIGVTLMPLGLIVTGGRAFLAPSYTGESVAEVLERVVFAGVAVLAYDWGWGAVTGLSRLITSGVLGLPWVTDGVERMLEALVIGGAAGSAVAAEFVVPLLVMIAGAVLLGLLMMRIGLEVAQSVAYATGGLIICISVTSFGRRLLAVWLIATSALLMVPVLWSILFAVGAALMLDAGVSGAHGGFGSFVAQLYNVAAALAVFAIAIKLALAVFRQAGGAIAGITASTGRASSGSGAGGARAAGRVAALAQNATPAGLARFSRSLRGGLGAAAGYPFRHPVRTAQAGSYGLRRPVQATREAAAALGDALTATGARATQAGQRASDWYERERDGGRLGARAADARAHARANGRGQGRSDNGSARTPARGRGTRATATQERGARAGADGPRATPPHGKPPTAAARPPGAGAAPPATPRPPASIEPAAGASAPAPYAAAGGADGAPRRAAFTPPAADGGGSRRPLWLWRRASSERRDRKEKR